VSAVFTPKDYALTEIMDQIVSLIRQRNGLAE
jgi:(2R)-ethylmalonyl-CoA mutase